MPRDLLAHGEHRERWFEHFRQLVIQDDFAPVLGILEVICLDVFP